MVEIRECSLSTHVVRGRVYWAVVVKGRRGARHVLLRGQADVGWEREDQTPTGVLATALRAALEQVE